MVIDDSAFLSLSSVTIQTEGPLSMDHKTLTNA